MSSSSGVAHEILRFAQEWQRGQRSEGSRRIAFLNLTTLSQHRGFCFTLCKKAHKEPIGCSRRLYALLFVVFIISATKLLRLLSGFVRLRFQYIIPKIICQYVYIIFLSLFQINVQTTASISEFDHRLHYITRHTVCQSNKPFLVKKSQRYWHLKSRVL